jgi:hypothetical protein
MLFSRLSCVIDRGTINEEDGTTKALEGAVHSIAIATAKFIAG